MSCFTRAPQTNKFRDTVSGFMKKLLSLPTSTASMENLSWRKSTLSSPDLSSRLLTRGPFQSSRPARIQTAWTTRNWVVSLTKVKDTTFLLVTWLQTPLMVTFWKLPNMESIRVLDWTPLLTLSLVTIVTVVRRVTMVTRVLRCCMVTGVKTPLS